MGQVVGMAEHTFMVNFSFGEMLANSALSKEHKALARKTMSRLTLNNHLQTEHNPDSPSPVAESKHGKSAVSVLTSLPGERRAKDRFIDHMLARYGHQVFKIPYTCDPEASEFQEVVNQIHASLANKE